MLVYCISDEDIKDPNTGESLGFLELVRGTGKIIFVQDKISILESDKTIDLSSISGLQNTTHNITIKTNSIDHLYIGQISEHSNLIPFDNPQVGDLVKPI